MSDLLLAHRWPEESLQELTNRMLHRVNVALQQGVQFGNLRLTYEANPRLNIGEVTVFTCQDQVLGRYEASAENRRNGFVLYLLVGEHLVKWDGDRFKPKAFRTTVMLDKEAIALMQREDRGGKQATMEKMIEWAIQLPRMGSLRSPDEAMGLLRQFEGRRIQAAEALNLLRLASSNTVARDLLWQLHDQERIKLIHGNDHSGITIGPNKSYFYFLEVP